MKKIRNIFLRHLLKKPCLDNNYAQVFQIGLLFWKFSIIHFNHFSSVNDYWMYKYRNTTVPENSNNTYLTPLQLSWNSYLSISSMIPNVSFLFINAFLGKDAIKKDKTLIEVFCKSKIGSGYQKVLKRSFVKDSLA